MRELITQWRFTLLLVALLLNILLAPILSINEYQITPLFAQIGSQTAFTFLLIVIVFVAGHNQKLKFAYVLFALAALAFSWVNLDNTQLEISFYRSLFSFAALSVAMMLIIVEIFSNRRVTPDTISGALCAYLLLGLIFTSVFAIVDTIQPGSFISTVTGERIDLHLPQAGLDRIYFSFVTLLTVGYGDITPHLPLAKLLAILEGFLGQVYLVVLIARLVGMHVSQGNGDSA